MNRRALVLALVGVLLACAGDARAAGYVWPVVRVIDGDTLKIDAGANPPSELAALSVRVCGVDTPERGGRVVADVLVDGRSLTGALIEHGLGRVYDGGFVLTYPVSGAVVEARRALDERFKVAGDGKLRLYADAIAAFVGGMRRAGGATARVEPVRVAITLDAIEAGALPPRGRAVVV